MHKNRVTGCMMKKLNNLIFVCVEVTLRIRLQRIDTEKRRTACDKERSVFARKHFWRIGAISNALVMQNILQCASLHCRTRDQTTTNSKQLQICCSSLVTKKINKVSLRRRANYFHIIIDFNTRLGP